MYRVHTPLLSPLVGQLTVILLLSAVPLQAAVYRCESADGPVLFSQFQCPPHNHQQTLDPTPRNLVTVPELSAAEITALRRLETQLRSERDSGQRQRRRQREQAAARAAESRKLCTAAEHDLKTLAADRRAGYSAAEGRRLDRREAELRQLRKANCARWQ